MYAALVIAMHDGVHIVKVDIVTRRFDWNCMEFDSWPHEEITILQRSLSTWICHWKYFHLNPSYNSLSQGLNWSCRIHSLVYKVNFHVKLMNSIDWWYRMRVNLSRKKFGGLVQDCTNCIANALELLQSCTKPSIYVSMPLPYKYLHPHNQIISQQYAANVHLSSIFIVQKAAKSHLCFLYR